MFLHVTLMCCTHTFCRIFADLPVKLSIFPEKNYFVKVFPEFGPSRKLSLTWLKNLNLKQANYIPSLRWVLKVRRAHGEGVLGQRRHDPLRRRRGQPRRGAARRR